jgi:hypothetical protein
MSYFIDQALTLDAEYIISRSLNLLLFSQDELIICIIALYMAILAWKNYRYP